MARLFFLRFRSLLSLSATLVVASFLSFSCGGSTTDHGGTSAGVKPGSACAAEGANGVAEDGCNTCSCTSGAWSCTKKACPAEDGGSTTPGSCDPSTSKPTTDGCNACSCTTDGSWVCTNRACPPTGQCRNGDTMAAPDGCNTCGCSNGQWACTEKACVAPACKAGETMNDGCNNCACAGGQWACTARFCPPPLDAGSARRGCGARLGDTCVTTEYCAYQVGQMCGAADASAVCMPRPDACDTVYDPVCGCDGKTHGNACEAAMAGTGVNTKGACLASF